MSVPEVEIAIGKIGRVESPLDPAPISMVETVIQYRRPESRTEHAWDRPEPPGLCDPARIGTFERVAELVAGLEAAFGVGRVSHLPGR